MSDASNVARGLRERLGSTTEERLGKALTELLENPIFTGAIGRAVDAREKAAQAQEVAMGALNIPSAADIERLTRRLRSVSHRLEGIEDGVDRLDRALAPTGLDRSEIGERLSAIEAQLRTLMGRLDQLARSSAGAARSSAAAARSSAGAAKPSRAKAKPAVAAAKRRAGKAKKPAAGKAKPASGKAKPASGKAKPASGNAKRASGKAKT